VDLQNDSNPVAHTATEGVVRSGLLALAACHLRASRAAFASASESHLIEPTIQVSRATFGRNWLAPKFEQGVETDGKETDSGSEWRTRGRAGE
jgi:hypothetical protein